MYIKRICEFHCFYITFLYFSFISFKKLTKVLVECHNLRTIYAFRYRRCVFKTTVSHVTNYGFCSRSCRLVTAQINRMRFSAGRA